MKACGDEAEVGFSILVTCPSPAQSVVRVLPAGLGGKVGDEPVAVTLLAAWYLLDVRSGHLAALDVGGPLGCRELLGEEALLSQCPSRSALLSSLWVEVVASASVPFVKKSTVKARVPKPASDTSTGTALKPRSRSVLNAVDEPVFVESAGIITRAWDLGARWMGPRSLYIWGFRAILWSRVEVDGRM